MTKIPLEFNDVDARDDRRLAEYEFARDMIHTPAISHGIEELEQLAHQGSVMSILMIADAMRQGWLYAKDLAGAVEWYRVAVDAGSLRALHGLALAYREMGRLEEAVSHLEDAIERGFPPAYNSLAAMLFKGEEIPVDRAKALSLWKTGAALGHLPSRRNLLQQRLQGRYGLLGRVRGFLDIVPFALEYVTVRNETPYTDRLR